MSFFDKLILSFCRLGVAGLDPKAPGAAAQCLPAKAPGLRIGWQAANCTCKGKAPCQQACSLELNPRRKGGPERRDCTHCGDCVNTCASYGKALEWRGMGRGGV